MDVVLMEDEIAPQTFDGEPEQYHEQEIEEIAKEALPESGKREALKSGRTSVFMNFKVATGFAWLGHRERVRGLA
jgi:hypothetical protein